MRIRFTARAALRHGPMYNVGEEVDLPEDQALDFLTGGFAQKVLPPAKPPARELDRPPADKMVRRGETQRKDR